MSRRVRVAARTVFALLGFAFLGWSLVEALNDPNLTVRPTATSVALAVGLVVVGLWSAVAGWARLLGCRVDRAIARGFLVAQLGKYVPGGVWQAVGQIGMAAPAAGSGARATTAFAASILTQVAGGLTVGSLLVLTPGTPGWVRVMLPLAALTSVALLVQPGWMKRAVGLFPPVRRRLGNAANFPTRRQLIASWGWAVATMTTAGLVYMIAYRAPAGDVILPVIPAYAVAWTVGFLAVPFPAGLGVREGALLLLLPSGGRTGLVAAAAVVRVIYIVGEVIAIATTIGPTTSPGSTDPHDEVGQEPDGEQDGAGDQYQQRVDGDGEHRIGHDVVDQLHHPDGQEC